MNELVGWAAGPGEMDLQLESLFQKRMDGGFQCFSCSYTSTKKSNIKKHVETYMETAGHQCSYCYKQCRTKNSLDAHISVYHREERKQPIFSEWLHLKTCRGHEWYLKSVVKVAIRMAKAANHRNSLVSPSRDGTLTFDRVERYKFQPNLEKCLNESKIIDRWVYLVVTRGVHHLGILVLSN